MIKIDFPEPTCDEWQEWRRECNAARDKLVERVKRGRKPQIKDLYKDQRMKKVYKSRGAPFFGKCVYCECDVAASHPGDIEHWRPKNRVTDGCGRVVKVENEDGNAVAHPGYYWLAYAWRNLLFSCEDCNRPSTAKTSGRRIGKRDQFPVRGFRATREGEELDECPILLNPVEENPADHLEVDDTGVIFAKTDRGQACIDIFGLNAREALRNARLESIKDTRARIQSMFLTVFNANSQSEKKNAICEYTEKARKIENGEVPYSACQRLALRKFKDDLKTFGNPS